MNRNVFICHASEDKSSVVYPLCHALEEQGVTIWRDDLNIEVGDSITGKVNEGLRSSRFMVVVFSRSFIQKNWPKRELLAVLNSEISSGKTIILPVMVGTREEIEQIVDEYPLLADKYFLRWTGDANGIAREIALKVEGKALGVRQNTPLHICGHCRTPFEHGTNVCLGCHGTVRYGMTPEELKTVWMVASFAFLMVSFYITHEIEMISQFIDTTPGVAGIRYLFTLVVISIFGGGVITAFIAHHRKGWIRTFR